MASVGSIIAGGFRLFREQPVAVLAWGVIQGVLTASSSVMVIGAMRNQLAAAQAGAGSPFAVLQWLIPFYLIMCVVGLVMTAAAFRAVVRPEARAAAFLRLSGDEARLLVLALFWFILNLLLYIVLVVIFGAVIGMVMAGSTSTSSAAAMIPLVLLLALPILALMIFFHIRLSPAIPLTILRRQIVIGEAWRLTRGQFWKLFAAYLVIMLMLAAGYVAVVSITMGSYWASLAGGGLGARSVEAANQYRMAQMTTITPYTIIGWIVSAAFGAASYALWAGSVGTATLELLGVEDQDYAATFE